MRLAAGAALIVLAVAAPTRADETNDRDGATSASSTYVVSGVVRRPPAATAERPAPSRYRERRRPSQPDAERTDAGCACNPGLFAVVQLVGDDLPPLDLTIQPPTMSQKERRFVPSVLAVPVGGVVDFPNLDPFFHNVFSYSKTRKFDLGRYPEGQSQTVEFQEAGIVPIFCEIHYSMRAYVHVVETPYFTVSDEQRQFEIRDVRPGEYVLRVWQEGLPELEQAVVVTDEAVWIEVP